MIEILKILKNTKVQAFWGIRLTYSAREMGEKTFNQQLRMSDQVKWNPEEWVLNWNLCLLLLSFLWELLLCILHLTWIMHFKLPFCAFLLITYQNDYVSTVHS